jgi:DNA sulfur modification protein DndC
VVEKDHSMSGFIETGQNHLTPMLEMRDWLAEIRNMKEKRSYKRRTGGEGVGPFTLETRREILTRLLNVQRKVGMELIQPREIELIHQIWTQEGDWQGGVTSIVQELDMGHLGPSSLTNERGMFGPEEDAILKKLCDAQGVPHDLVKRMLHIEKEATGLARRRGIYDRLVRALDEAWMTKEEAAAFRERLALEEMNAAQDTDAQ